MSASIAARKEKEAAQLVKDANSYLKTGLFKRQPDHDSASTALAAAGTAYKVAKLPEKAIECFERAALFVMHVDSSSIPRI